MMKALSTASILALTIAGTACSQTSDATSEDATPETAKTETVEAADDVGGSFNLGLPTEAATDTAAGGSFNLGLPAGAATTTDGFNLGTAVSGSNGLAELPVVETPISDALPTEADEDDEPVIRLE